MVKSTAQVSPFLFRSAGAELSAADLKDHHRNNTNSNKKGDAANNTPPSSYCGSDCLYSTLNVPNLQKFFNTKQVKKDLCCDSDQQPEGGDETSSALELVEKNEAAARSMADQKIEDARKKSAADGADRRQIKFSFFESKDENDIGNKEEEDKVSDTAVMMATSSSPITAITSAAPATTAAEEGRQTKFFFWDQLPSATSTSAFDKVTSPPSPPNLHNTATNKRKEVRFIPVMDSLFDGSVASATACSFASSLTSVSSNQRRYELIELSTRPDNPHYRLSNLARSQLLADCRAYRLQISTFEDLFQKEHGHAPTSTEERNQLSHVYRKYREGKRTVRNDGAARVQALVRGGIVRNKLARVTTSKSRKHKHLLAEKTVKHDSVELTAVATRADTTPSPETIKEMAQAQIRDIQALKLDLLNLKMEQEEPTSSSDAQNKKFSFYTPSEIMQDLAGSYTPPKIENKDWTSPNLSEDIVATCRNAATVVAAASGKPPVVVTPDGGRKRASPSSVTATAAVAVANIEVPTINSTPIEQGALSRQMILEYLTSEERTQIATKALSNKLLDKEVKLPDDSNAPEAICSICEMPRLASKETGLILDNCVVCTELDKKVSRRRNQHKKKQAKQQMLEAQKKKEKAAEAEAEKAAKLEQMKLAKLRQQEMLLSESKPTLSSHFQQRGLRRHDNEDWFHNAYNTEALLDPEYRQGMDWSLSLPSTLHLPSGTGACDSTIEQHHRPADDSIDTPESASNVEEESRLVYGFGEVAGGGTEIICDVRNELAPKKKSFAANNVSASSDSSGTFTTANQHPSPKHIPKEVVEDDASEESEDSKDSEVEKDEFDMLLDDASIEQLQRKIRGCPSPSQMAIAQEKLEQCQKDKKKKKRADVVDEVEKKGEAAKKKDSAAKEKAAKPDQGVDGLASKTDFDNFQHLYDEFEKDHADVVEYIRDHVSKSDHHKKSTKPAANAHKRHTRASSMPSLSSLCDSREYQERGFHEAQYEEYRGNHHHVGRGGCDYGQQYQKETHRHYNRGHYPAASVSELSPPNFAEERDYERERHGSRKMHHRRSHPKDHKDHHRSHPRERRHPRRSYSRERHGRYSRTRGGDRRASSRERYNSRHYDREGGYRHSHQYQSYDQQRRSPSRRTYEKGGRSRSYERRHHSCEYTEQSQYSSDYSSEYGYRR